MLALYNMLPEFCARLMLFRARNALVPLACLAHISMRHPEAKQHFPVPCQVVRPPVVKH